jgi:hypothetical protein
LPLWSLVAGIVGVLARPVLIGLAARLGWLAVILCAAVGEAVILGGAMALVPGVEVQSGWTLIATAWLAGLVGTLLAWIASAGTDEGFATALYGGEPSAATSPQTAPTVSSSCSWTVPLIRCSSGRCPRATRRR